jgi:hypothetical protein
MSTTGQYPDFTGLTFEKIMEMYRESFRMSEILSEQISQMRDQIREQSAKTDRQISRTEEIVGNLGNRFGELVEQLVTAGAIPRFNAMGYHFTKASTRVKIIDPQTDRTLSEMDVVLENGEFVIVVEVKTEPSLSDIQKHIRRLQIFRRDRDTSSPNDNKKIFGAIAAAVFPDEVQEAALQAGFYVIVQSGDTVKIDVPEGFVPTAF